MYLNPTYESQKLPSFESHTYTTHLHSPDVEDFSFLPETPCVTALLPNRDVSLFAGLPLSDAVLTFFEWKLTVSLIFLSNFLSIRTGLIIRTPLYKNP